MSWVDKVRNEFIITTGDGKTYQPKWLNASVKTSYQTSNFEFIGVGGTLVEQREPIGNQYNLEIYFDGSDNLEVTRAFRESCTNKRPWTLQHPLYDLLFVKCPELNFDDSKANCTTVTGTMIETIVLDPLSVSVNPIDQIPLQIDQVTEDIVSALTETPSPSDINTLTNNANSVYKSGVPIITINNQAEEYTNKFNTALSYISTATATPLIMMRSLTALLQAPAQFEVSVIARIGVLVDAFNALRRSLLSFTSVSSKQLYQNQSSALVSAVCLSAATPQTQDYKNANSILSTINGIVLMREQFIADMDLLQTPNGGSVLSFVPNSTLLLSLNEMVNLTISALYNLSLSARSERSFICDKDTNMILLAHMVYGLDANDNNVNDLIDQNSISLNEYLQVEKGRIIRYYI